MNRNSMKLVPSGRVSTNLHDLLYYHVTKLRSLHGWIINTKSNTGSFHAPPCIGEMIYEASLDAMKCQSYHRVLLCCMVIGWMDFGSYQVSWAADEFLCMFAVYYSCTYWPLNYCNGFGKLIIVIVIIIRCPQWSVIVIVVVIIFIVHICFCHLCTGEAEKNHKEPWLG
jgi:hypothetical protein